MSRCVLFCHACHAVFLPPVPDLPDARAMSSSNRPPLSPHGAIGEDVQLAPAVFDAVVDGLIRQGLIEEITGDKKGKNGLFPIKSAWCD